MTTDEADVRPVDVAIDDGGHFVADVSGAHGIGGAPRRRRRRQRGRFIGVNSSPSSARLAGAVAALAVQH
jgi:hypothetical protein